MSEGCKFVQPKGARTLELEFCGAVADWESDGVDDQHKIGYCQFHALMLQNAGSDLNFRLVTATA